VTKDVRFADIIGGQLFVAPRFSSVITKDGNGPATFGLVN